MAHNLEMNLIEYVIPVKVGIYLCRDLETSLRWRIASKKAQKPKKVDVLSILFQKGHFEMRYFVSIEKSKGEISHALPNTNWVSVRNDCV